MVLLKNYVAAKWNLQKNMTEKDVIVLNFNQDLAKELATKTKARGPSIFNGRKGGRCLFGRWTSQV